jgi:agmatine/peptidylarginine deiminase
MTNANYRVSKAIFQLGVVLVALSIFLVGCSLMTAKENEMEKQAKSRRVPAEWEPHESTWLQWPKGWEKGYQGTFSEIVKVLQAHEPVNLIVEDEIGLEVARNFLDRNGIPLSNIQWHIMPYDWAWMRDNGPVWVESEGEIVLQLG